MKRNSLHILSLLAVILCASLVWAESQARIVRLSLVDGSVEADRAAGQGFERAIQNMPITQGMRLRTGSGSNAEVEFESGSTLRLIGNTTVSFGRLSLANDGGKLTAVNVEEGTAYFKVKKQSHDEFAVSFAGREMRVTHSSHFRVDVSESNAEVAMFKGEAELANDSSVRLKNDQTLTFDRGGDAQLAQSNIGSGVTDEPSDAWDKQREDAVERYAQQNEVANSPYAYGMSDLAQYGSYYNDASYGWVWRPYGVGNAWDPYNNGAWMWYPGSGYTWVSSYPWGWTPYRHGRWVFLPAYGWVWQPGYWNNWWAGPVIVNAPSYYVVPRPPRYRDHHVAWVGPPPNNWTGPHHNWDRDHDRDHDRDRDRNRDRGRDRDGDRDRQSVKVQTHDRDDAGTRKTVTMSAPAPAGNTTQNVPASGLAGGGSDSMVITTPKDVDALRRGGGPLAHDAVRLPRDRDGDKPGRGTAVVVGQTPSATPGQPRVDRHSPQGHVDVPRSTVVTPRNAPAPSRVETPRAAPAPRATPAPRVEAPRSAPSSPHMDSPHMSAPSHSGGGHASGGGRSPK
jgi:hypothetical protein